MVYCKALVNMRYVLFYFVLFCSCTSSSRQEKVRSLLESDDQTEVIEGCNELKTVKDTMFVSAILLDPYDQRISHNLKFKGISVYQAKMNALRRISNLNPPNKVNYLLDSTNVLFYLNWARTQKLIK